MKTALKILLYPIVGFLIFIGLYLFVAYSFSRISIEKEPNSKEEIEIYIKTNGVHTDLVVPIRSEFYDWSKEVLFENTVSKDTNYTHLAMGWGDRGFYLETPEWKDLKTSVAFNAAFGLSTTAIHATFYKDLNVADDCKKIIISKEQFQRLIAYIKNSFQKDKKGHFINIKTNAVYSKNDSFYEANGKYSMLHTCNTWANNGLKVSGQKCCLWTIFDTGIFLKYK